MISPTATFFKKIIKQFFQRNEHQNKLVCIKAIKALWISRFGENGLLLKHDFFRNIVKRRYLYILLILKFPNKTRDFRNLLKSIVIHVRWTNDFWSFWVILIKFKDLKPPLLHLTYSTLAGHAHPMMFM